MSRKASEFGKIAALGNAGLGAIGQTDRGVALAAGYEFDGADNSWRADLGTTPLGFTEQTVVGGFRYRGGSGRLVRLRRRLAAGRDQFADLLRRRHGPRHRRDLGRRGAQRHPPALRAGHRPRERVRRRGRRALHRPQRGDQPRVHGPHRLRPARLRPARPARDQRAGAELLALQRQPALLLVRPWRLLQPAALPLVRHPARLDRRYARWSWRLQGSAGWSFTYEDDAPYFPTRPDLQQLAGNPIYTGGSGGGFSYTLGATVEYTFAPHWVAGAGFQIDRSRDYAPNRAMVWLRYLFDRRRDPVPFPPNPVRPYSAY